MAVSGQSTEQENTQTFANDENQRRKRTPTKQPSATAAQATTSAQFPCAKHTHTTSTTHNKHTQHKNASSPTHDAMAMSTRHECECECAAVPPQLTANASVWALIAEQLLVTQRSEEEKILASCLSMAEMRSARRDGVRAFCNLMMTCRELYLDLPWAMPKWCLSDVLLTVDAYSGYISRAARQRMLIVDWMDTSQPALVRVEEEEDEDEEEDTSAGTSATPTSDTKDTTAAATTPAREVWLENRFLAYAWLGVTWDSRCAFLQAKLVATQRTAGGFWSTFARCGRVHFTELSALDAWAAATHDEQMDEVAVEEGQAAEGMEDTRDMNAVPLEPHQQEQQQDQQHQRRPRRPAVFSLAATLHNQQEADQWSELRDTALAGAQGSCVDLTVIAGLSLLAARDVNKLVVSTLKAAVDQVSFANVAHVRWKTHKTQRSIHGKLRVVERLVLSNAASVDDISLLASIPAITLSSYNCLQPLDLASLAGVKTLCLSGGRYVNEQQALATAQQLDLSRVALRCGTLQAAHVKLGHPETTPDVLHLPNATHIELVSTSGVKQVTCPPRINTLVIEDLAHTMPVIPEFEHAQQVDLNLKTPLTREQLADLGRRVDSLVLRGTTVAHMADLQDIPDNVHVQLMSVCVDGPVPTCVDALEVDLDGIDGYRGAWMSSAPSLVLPGRHPHRPVQDLHLLSGRKLLRVSECDLAGELSRCDHLILSSCSGSVSVSRIESLLIDAAALTLPRDATVDGSGAGSNTMTRARKQLAVTGVHDVAHCRLQRCSIEAFEGCIEHVQRLILSRCTFDSVDDLPHVGSLVLRECTTEDKAWRWPDVVMTGRTPAEMAHVLMQGKERCEVHSRRW
ncbi:hypothetical protein PTSG_04004 [Salpingoeca rosetta]|uniref:Uncharacterized protein n=1 Tax=Salpingoeca rosetta (strain ATCC 50818 / BSB-021) TaxID=946362 RepID=F2U7I0_SALR5|nr:uncharacterized protein PTSG_04004 [Salpingoeca rosetta]EGD83397.1 hypothetical protein PTSG_04004 [Salpingoeca rosetta]|eukprot:XP_004994901.1 hypothetical protein PTSG_04004 [Salpingoeca rosetta]